MGTATAPGRSERQPTGYRAFIPAPLPQDVLAAEARIFSPNQPDDVDEVFNYVGAMNYGLERLSTVPVSVRLMREIHARLLHRRFIYRDYIDLFHDEE